MTSNDLVSIHAETGISGVLSLQHDDCLSYWHIDYDKLYKSANGLNIRMIRCPIRDFDVPDMRRMLPNAVSSLAELTSDGHKIYVHCTAGLGRAPSTVLAYLIWIKNYSPENAIGLILKGRPEAVPAWEALQVAKMDMVRLYWSEIEKRAYHFFQLGVHNDSVSDWLHAENEIIRSALTA